VPDLVIGWQSVSAVPLPFEPGAEVTVTVTLALTEPALLVATSVYAVVAESFTVIGLAAATPFNVTVGLVPVTVQLSTELPPAATDVADAAKLAMTGAVTEGGGEGFVLATVTNTLFLALPPGPVAVRIKIVDLETVVMPEPLLGGNGSA
jgi:hypothetical protein